MQVEFQLDPGSVIDVPGLPPIRVRLSDPPGTFRILVDAEWQPVAVADKTAAPTQWTAIGATGWETRWLAPSTAKIMVRPAGGVLPSAATG